jgi:hypothetical protein
LSEQKAYAGLGHYLQNILSLLTAFDIEISKVAFSLWYNGDYIYVRLYQDKKQEFKFLLLVYGWRVTSTDVCQNCKTMVVVERRYIMADERGYIMADERGYIMADERGYIMADERGYIMADERGYIMADVHGLYIGGMCLYETIKKQHIKTVFIHLLMQSE